MSYYEKVYHCPNKIIATFLLNKLDKAGYKWAGGESMTTTNWEKYGDKTHYFLKDKKLWYGGDSFLGDEKVNELQTNSIAYYLIKKGIV